MHWCVLIIFPRMSQLPKCIVYTNFPLNLLVLRFHFSTFAALTHRRRCWGFFHQSHSWRTLGVSLPFQGRSWNHQPAMDHCLSQPDPHFWCIPYRCPDRPLQLSRCRCGQRHRLQARCNLNHVRVCPLLRKSSYVIANLHFLYISSVKYYVYKNWSYDLPGNNIICLLPGK